jgi:hypothetical protein
MIAETCSVFFTNKVKECKERCVKMDFDFDFKEKYAFTLIYAKDTQMT